jgi:predicted transcriptional regulator
MNIKDRSNFIALKIWETLFETKMIGYLNDILEVAKEDGARKTAIMYKANLSHDQMKHYLGILTKKNFLYYDLHTQRFKTTEKGLSFLEVYKRVESMIKTQEVLPTPPLGQRQVQMQGGNKPR